jgi:hypothetical protein
MRAAGLLLAGLVLASSLTADVAAAHTASRARWTNLAARTALVTRSERLRVAALRSSGRPWSGRDGTSSRGGATARWGGTRLTGSTGNQLGFSVAIAGTTAIASAPGVNNNAGAVYFWHHVGGSWHKVLTWPDPRGATNDNYAWSVAMSSTSAGTYMAIGGNDNNGKPDFVYVYKQGSGFTWNLEAKIRDPGNNYLDMFGDALAISSTTLVVGASCVNDFSGAAYIYQRSGTHWNREASMSDPLGNSSDSYGGSVAVSGNRVLVGDLDVAYVYTHTSGQGWPLTAAISNPGPSGDSFGQSVTLSGTTAVIGAPYGTQGEGAAYVYRLSGTTWSQQQELTEPGGGEFGWSVAMSGSRLVVGEPIDGEPSCGTAYAFKLSGTQFTLLGQIADPDKSCTTGTKFGYSVALTGTYGIFGAPGANNGRGANYELPLP